MSVDRSGSGRSGNAPGRHPITGSFAPGVDLISSVVAGLLMGLGLDWWLNTGPIFVIVGIVVGFGSGFYKLWEYSAVLEEQAKDRRRGS